MKWVLGIGALAPIILITSLFIKGPGKSETPNNTPEAEQSTDNERNTQPKPEPNPKPVTVISKPRIGTSPEALKAVEHAERAISLMESALPIIKRRVRDNPDAEGTVISAFIHGSISEINKAEEITQRMSAAERIWFHRNYFDRWSAIAKEVKAEGKRFPP